MENILSSDFIDKLNIVIFMGLLAEKLDIEEWEMSELMAHIGVKLNLTIPETLTTIHRKIEEGMTYQELKNVYCEIPDE